MTYICLAPFTLDPGVSEEQLLEASSKFEREFVLRRPGIQRRMLLRAADGSYADLVFFESRAAAEEVMHAEQSSPACKEFFGLMQSPEKSQLNTEVLGFELIQENG